MHGSNGFHNAILSNNPDCEPSSCALCYFIMPNTWFQSMLTSDTSGGRPQTTRAHGERFTCSQSRRVHPSKCKVQLSDATWTVKIDRDFYLMQIFAINPWIFFFCELNAVHTWRFMLHLRKLSTVHPTVAAHVHRAREHPMGWEHRDPYNLSPHGLIL